MDATLKKSRKNKRLSQRQLAALANISFRTIQLVESGNHDSQISTLSRIANALGYPPHAVEHCLETLFSSSPDSITIISEQISTHGEASWKLWLFHFVDAFRRTHDSDLIAAPPIMNLSDRMKALIAATVETLCTERDSKIPWWCQAMPYLTIPWFVADIENLKALALVESPLHFRKRNIFVLENFLERR